MANLLIVDDDRSFLSALESGLKSRGYQITTAENGYEAVARMRAAPFDLVITDLMMPGGGVMVVRGAQQQPRPVPVIVMTSHRDESMLRQMSDLGLAALLRKPFSFVDLMAAITEASTERCAGPFETASGARREFSRGEN